MTQAVQYSAVGGPEVLELHEVPEPVAGPGQVVVEVEAAGVNPIDAKLRAGIRPGAAFDKPRGVGFDGAGFIKAVGEGVDGFRVGDPVAFGGATIGDGVGAYASETAVKASGVSLLPDGVSVEQGAALGIPAGTAYQALRSLGVRSGDTLLIHGGSGSVGQAAIQFAVSWGAKVIATTSARRADRVAQLGATPVGYGEGLVERVRNAGEVTAILDGFGSDEVLAQSFELLADRQRIATIVSGAKADDLGIRAFSGGSPHPLTDQQEAWRAEALPVTLALIGAGAFDVELGDRFGLARAADAHRDLAQGAIGKLIIEPEGA
ncbi:NADP-dependent oxidoreductase [Microbacterium halophytorum]|uniref:NADP-dependent oxidoreductase n=1 Tax=Microbacterium halophytorum TaxID=2067568 RepID=UPI000CFE0811|nr:NADP-dependent oxidoreductase [Microbacterium halophytorum]